MLLLLVGITEIARASQMVPGLFSISIIYPAAGNQVEDYVESWSKIARDSAGTGTIEPIKVIEKTARIDF